MTNHMKLFNPWVCWIYLEKWIYIYAFSIIYQNWDSKGRKIPPWKTVTCLYCIFVIIAPDVFEAQGAKASAATVMTESIIKVVDKTCWYQTSNLEIEWPSYYIKLNNANYLTWVNCNNKQVLYSTIQPVSPPADGQSVGHTGQIMKKRNTN